MSTIKTFELDEETYARLARLVRDKGTHSAESDRGCTHMAYSRPSGTLIYTSDHYMETLTFASRRTGRVILIDKRYDFEPIDINSTLD